MKAKLTRQNPKNRLPQCAKDCSERLHLEQQRKKSSNLKIQLEDCEGVDNSVVFKMSSESKTRVCNRTTTTALLGGSLFPLEELDDVL